MELKVKYEGKSTTIQVEDNSMTISDLNIIVGKQLGTETPINLSLDGKIELNGTALVNEVLQEFFQVENLVLTAIDASDLKQEEEVSTSNTLNTNESAQNEPKDQEGQSEIPDSKVDPSTNTEQSESEGSICDESNKSTEAAECSQTNESEDNMPFEAEESSESSLCTAESENGAELSEANPDNTHVESTTLKESEKEEYTESNSAIAEIESEPTCLQDVESQKVTAPTERAELSIEISKQIYEYIIEQIQLTEDEILANESTICTTVEDWIDGNDACIVVCRVMAQINKEQTELSLEKQSSLCIIEEFFSRKGRKSPFEDLYSEEEKALVEALA